eukprot:TRINITY_DN13119_c0_g1_i1.p1 TRINITY_DN13119_c0_g1~~TRINITY_DN13119_c0_g1_i1.p1  ORF type:complete len:102 (-),score=15.79 TRINITY_DN13119_c0_g1_i1:524-829(-)
MYHFRIFERLWGSEKFITFIIIVISLSNLLEVALLVLLPVNPHIPVNGLHSIVFAFLVQYWTDIPALDKLILGGYSTNSKILVYLLCFQVSCAFSWVILFL